MKIPVSGFNDNLLEINDLKPLGFHEWVFHPGMLFNSNLKWWGGEGQRITPHEGVDLCFFRTGANKVLRLNDGTKIPLIYDGMIKAIEKDYLGYSIFVEHEFFSQNRNRFFSIYGHIDVDPALKVGRNLKEGTLLGKVAGMSHGKQDIMPHLHISIAQVDISFDDKNISWRNVSNSPLVFFLDPIEVLNIRFSFMDEHLLKGI
ncbi:peptidoglycan DD-metalloendopeptidase family protein [Spirochaetota bacterium]